MVDRSSDSRVLAQESGLRIVLTLFSWPRVLAQESRLRVVLTLISGSRVFALEPKISVAITKANHFDIGLCLP